MINAFKKKLYIVYFRCIDPNGEKATADCITEAPTSEQAKNQVITGMKSQGFSHIAIMDCRETIESDLQRFTNMFDIDNNALSRVKTFH
ncbi:hypothetical protein [Yersinia bercovieri]|uniref:hypothetical protein n=1 Tax=Yersinia bercovieri TaxID=634 RepID=UPI0025AAE405|nr:hypothetical protein [Yersinia bercovieri]MDN0101537.1 hypothetical protein [Yersinia bercovieri]